MGWGLNENGTGGSRQIYDSRPQHTGTGGPGKTHTWAEGGVVPQVWVFTESMSNSTQPFRVEGWERHTEDAIRTGGRGRPSGGIELFTDPKCVGYTRETLGPQMDRQVMALKTTKTIRGKPIALILGYWAGRDDKADASFFKKLRKGMNSIKKTHWLVLLGDYKREGRHGAARTTGEERCLEAWQRNLG